MKISTDQMSEAFDFAAYSLGNTYFINNSVISYTILSEGYRNMQITSKVSGSLDKTYYQQITIQHTESYRTLFKGECTCPVGYNCKHVAAVCFNLHYDIENKPKDLTTDWLKKLSNLSSIQNDKKQESEPDQQYLIIYRLFTHQYNRDNVSLFKANYLKSGAISKGSPRRIENLNETLSQYMDENDKEVTELLINMRDNRYNYTIKGKIGYLFIKQVLETKRCFYKNSKTALSYDDNTIELEFYWNEQNKNYSKLKCQIHSDDFHIIPCKPILVIDLKNNTIRPMAYEINYEALQNILNAPEIPNNKINTAFQTLSSNYSQFNFPLPKGYTLNKIEKEAVPILNIYQNNNAATNTYLLSLKFAYADFEVTHLPQLQINNQYSETGKTEILRNIQQENDAVEQLQSFGFIPIQYETKHYMVIPSELIKSQRALQKWNDFLNIHIINLTKKGWKIEFDDGFNLKFNTDSQVEVESQNDNDWFSLSFNILFGGKRYPLAPLVSSVLAEFDTIEELPEELFVECEDSQYVELKTKDIKPVLKTLFELFDRNDGDNTLKIAAFDAHMLEEFNESIIWKGSKEILKLSRKLKDFDGINKVKPPTCLKNTLRDYQQIGLNWLNFLYEFKFSGILADDMGLGKTVQTLSHLSRLKQDKKLIKPSLIIVPTSLIANWKNEVEKFTPNLKLLTLYGNDREEKFKDVEKYDLILTTYTLVGNDIELHSTRKYAYIILDEAQKIKNPKTKMAKTICSLKSENRLALTGTPIENHLGELWSIFNFLMPGFLHSQKLFNDYYRKPIENDFNNQMQIQLNKRIKPFILRRTKTDVLTELPAKTEIIKLTQFENKQSKLYETIRISMNKKVRDAIAQKGLNKSHIHILDALLKLRQVCCDPSILKLDEAKKVKESAKLTLFLELIDELMEENRKVLVFSQFTSMLSILEREIINRKISYVKLTGSSTKRDEIIDKFTSGKADIFLISLKAGGVGLNLVEADTVIHYDPWWNPAVENQATDRAHRIGQNKKLFVYKLIVENTIEQKIIELQNKKKALQDGIYDKGGKLENKNFNGNELMELLKS